MLEVVTTKCAETSLSLDGKLLASKIDPRAEAKKWVANQLESLHGIKTAIVLGAGAGYHLAELKIAAPHLNLIAIEKNKALISHHEKNLELVRFGIKVISAQGDLLSHLLIQQALQSSYKVLLHPAGAITFKDESLYLKDLLNGRTQEGLEKITALRSWAAIKVDSKKALISFNDVDLKKRTSDQEKAQDFFNVAPLLKELLK